MLPDIPLAYLIKEFPEEGVDTWSLGYAWADPARSVMPEAKYEDLEIFVEHGVGTVRELLNENPVNLRRVTGIPLGCLTVYRLAARWWLASTSEEARRQLSANGWSEEAILRLSSGLAHRLASQLSDDFASYSYSSDQPVEVVVQMDDVISMEQLEEYEPIEQIEWRRQHASESQAPLLDSLGRSEDEITQVWLCNQFIAELSLEEIGFVAERPEVRQVSPALPVRASMDCGLTRVRAVNLMGAYKGDGEVVALLDSGVESAHPDFYQNQILHKKDYIGTGDVDECGHGTHLAGIIGADCGTYPGVAPRAEIWNYRVLDRDGKSGPPGAIAQAVQDALSEAGNKRIVVNASLEVPQGAANGPDDFKNMCRAFDFATPNAVVVTAAGNAGPDSNSITAPGGGTSVLTVGASVNRPAASFDVVSPFSSRGPAPNNRQKPDVVAPGGFSNPQGEKHTDVSVVSSRLTGGAWDKSLADDRPWHVDHEHWGYSGTSQATAVVSGLCVLLLQDATSQNKTVKHQHVKAAVKGSARELGYGKYEEGKGLVNADAAFTELRRIT